MPLFVLTFDPHAPPPLFAAKGPSKDTGTPAEQQFVRSIIELHDKYLAYVTTCFMGASLFHKSLKVGVSGGGRIRGLGFAGLQLPHPSFKQDPSKTLSMRSGAGTCPDVLSEQSRLCPASFTRGIAAHM